MHYSVSAKAYGKIIFHCAKYPHRAVNGVLIGTISKKDNSVQVQDCVPLFHAELDLTPMLEVALTQVEIYAISKGLSIVGYYHAKPQLDDCSLTDTIKSIGSKICQNSDVSCVLMVDNRKILTSHNELAVKMFINQEQTSQWKEQRNISLMGGDAVMSLLIKAVENGMFQKLIDFDNHLDCVDADWTNPSINKLIEELKEQ